MKVKHLVEQILKIVIADGKGIGGQYLLPPVRFKRHHAVAGNPEAVSPAWGKIITIGSDSHRPEHLGAYLGGTRELLKELGFERFCTFEKMQPVFHAL